MWSQNELTTEKWSQKRTYYGDMVTKTNLLRECGHKNELTTAIWSQK